MHKDVIYIDVEDDITIIIDKVKASSEQVVALVPPKRISVLQSAVNLRLLSRAATTHDKRLVLITNNHSLSSLAASAAIPVAKNLQSKPELGETTALEIDDDDVIDGSELPVGEHAKSAEKPDRLATTAAPSSLAATALAGAKDADATKKTKPTERTKPFKKVGTKVPNFNKFRKKMLLIMLLIVGLIAFLVWAIVFAPRATVVISAKTDDTSINQPVTMSAKATTSVEGNTIKAITKSESESKSVEFSATGSKNIGKKASGSVSFTKATRGSATIPAGSKLTSSGGLAFVLNSSVTVPGATLSFDCDGYLCPGEATGSVTAAEQGAKYNAADGSLRGSPDGVSASFSDATSGGTDKVVKVVTESDVQKAKQKLVDENTDEIRDTLKGQFGDQAIVLDKTFAVNFDAVSTSPNVGETVEGGNGTLQATVEYVLYGVERTEIGDFTTEYLKENEINDPKQQRVYNNGSDDATFQDIEKAANGATATLIATGKIGPQINEKQVKQDARSKKYGEIQADLQEIDGVNKVNVNFFPFWVTTVPDDVKRITVEFKVDES